MNIRKRLKNSSLLRKLHSWYWCLFGGNKFRGVAGNQVRIDGVLKHCRVDIHGTGNVINIRNPRCVNNLHIFINGDGNRIEIAENCYLSNLTLWMEDDHNLIRIGRDAIFSGGSQLNCIEGCEITIGETCMFASNTHMRTGDSHSILDSDGRRINPSEDIRIGNHVWVAQNVSILKGAEIGDNSICGTAAVVTRRFQETGVILAGVPAKITKQNISWCYDRI